MSSLYIANHTLQHQQFYYRVPEVPDARAISIPAGRQAKFPEDFSPEQFQAVVHQLERYLGAVAARDVKSLEWPRALIYSDREIGRSKIDEARELDQRVRQDVSAAAFENDGLGAFSASPNPIPGLAETAISITQVDTNGDDERGGVDFEAVVSKRAAKIARSPRK